MHRLAWISALCALALTTPVAAQEPDWDSEANRTWWNGVTEAELRELTAEAGGVWSDLPDEGDHRMSRIDWPDLPAVTVREAGCPTPERPMPERNCGAMLMFVAVDEPTNVEAWWLETDGWLAFGRVNSGPSLYRIEAHGLGTTRGHVLAALTLFRINAVAEISRIKAINGGW